MRSIIKHGQHGVSQRDLKIHINLTDPHLFPKGADLRLDESMSPASAAHIYL